MLRRFVAHHQRQRGLKGCAFLSSLPSSGVPPQPRVTTQSSATSCPIGAFPPGGATPCSVESSSSSVYSIVTTLGKAKLTALVAATAVAGSVLCVAPGAHLIPLALGTTLQGLSANSANQCIEIENDRLMKRTMKRPLVTGEITRRSAMGLSMMELVLGTAFLYVYSPYAAALGLVNWGIYVGAYTPLKRITTYNTEVGAIVGALPPIMGGILAGSVAGAAPSIWLGAIMFAWQLPHFMALSYFCRRDYHEAGFRMLAYHNPNRAALFAIGYAVLLQMLVMLGPWALQLQFPVLYYVLSMGLTSVMTWKSILFWRDPNRYCRGCFIYSYMFLAMQLCVMMASAIYQQWFLSRQNAEKEEGKEHVPLVVES